MLRVAGEPWIETVCKGTNMGIRYGCPMGQILEQMFLFDWTGIFLAWWCCCRLQVCRICWKHINSPLQLFRSRATNPLSKETELGSLMDNSTCAGRCLLMSKWTTGCGLSSGQLRLFVFRKLFVRGLLMVGASLVTPVLARLWLPLWINYGPLLPCKAIFFGMYDQVNLCLSCGQDD